MNIEELRKKKAELGITNEKISELSGVPVSTVQKVFGGATGRPREKTLQKIERALIKSEIDKKLAVYKDIPDDSSWVHETNVLDLYDAYYANVAYPIEPVPDDIKAPDKRQGEYTLQDFYAMPPDRKVELIDGVIYDMAEPTDVHQLIIGAMYYQISTQIMAQELDCIPFGASIDVRINMDNRTMVAPDIVVVCADDHDAGENDENESDNDPGDAQEIAADGQKADDLLAGGEAEGGEREDSLPLGKRAHRYFDGPPDFVVEVLSPSNRDYDAGTKKALYMRAGVREYWAVDPETERIAIFMSDRPVVCLYTFNDTVPVTISDGRIEVDFSVIRKSVHRQLDVLRRADRRTKDLYR